MGWPLRVEAPGAIYHVTSRAIEPMFVHDADRERFLALLARQVRDHGWICHAYCLMSNHVHLLLETPEPTLATGMRTLLSRYARGFNGRQGRRGPLVERRYHALLIEKESHLLEVSRYVVLNPSGRGSARIPPNGSGAATGRRSGCSGSHASSRRSGCSTSSEARSSSIAAS